MSNVLIIDAVSTGQNYIFDILEAGHKPVVMYSKMNKNADPMLFVEREELKKEYEKYAKYYEQPDTYEDTLKLARKINPIFILPGTEEGVELSVMLSDDLGLPGNKKSRIDYFTKKDKMQEALKEYGIRSLAGKICYSVEEAVDYYNEQNFSSCIIKPVRSAASVGIHLCDDVEDLKKYIKQELNSPGLYGNTNKGILVQERVVGTEYIVNTFSYAGKHYLSSVWYYQRIKDVTGGNLHDVAISLSKLDIGSTKLIKYAFDVCDALQIDYGACHGEFMVDEKGPALIEVNCRPMGSSMPPVFIKSLWGHHETNLVVKAYLNKKKLYDAYTSHSHKYSNGIIKVLRSPITAKYTSVPMVSLVKHLKSYVDVNISTHNNEVIRTIDFETSPAQIYLQNKDKRILDKEVRFIKNVEDNYFQMFFEVDKVDEQNKPKNLLDIKRLIDLYCKYDNKLIVTNNMAILNGKDIVSVEEINKVSDKYDVGIIDLDYDGNRDLAQYNEVFYSLSKKILSGGKIIVPNKSFWYLPFGYEYIEMLSKWRDYEILPSNAVNQEVFISKNPNN